MARFTARDIAKHIQRPGEPMSAAVDRFRNWAKTGIIEPSGEHNPGTGRKKQFSYDALVRAVILQALVDAMGSPAISFSPMLGGMARSFQRKDAESRLVVLSREAGGQGFDLFFTSWKNLPRKISESDYAVHTVIDLRRIYDRVRLEEGETPRS